MRDLRMDRGNAADHLWLYPLECCAVLTQDLLVGFGEGARGLHGAGQLFRPAIGGVFIL